LEVTETGQCDRVVFVLREDSASMNGTIKGDKNDIEKASHHLGIGYVCDPARHSFGHGS
jgi:hypothetical protein